jgi:hypothetical protein
MGVEATLNTSTAATALAESKTLGGQFLFLGRSQEDPIHIANSMMLCASHPAFKHIPDRQLPRELHEQLSQRAKVLWVEAKQQELIAMRRRKRYLAEIENVRARLLTRLRCPHDFLAAPPPRDGWRYCGGRQVQSGPREPPKVAAGLRLCFLIAVSVTQSIKRATAHTYMFITFG